MQLDMTAAVIIHCNNVLTVCLQPFRRSAEAGAGAVQQEDDSAPAWVPAPMKRLTKLLTSCSSPSPKAGSQFGALLARESRQATTATAAVSSSPRCMVHRLAAVYMTVQAARLTCVTCVHKTSVQAYSSAVFVQFAQRRHVSSGPCVAGAQPRRLLAAWAPPRPCPAPAA